MQRPIYPHAQRMRNHWWWRPGWREGRAFYTWFVTSPKVELRELAAAHQAQLGEVDGLDFVPLDWLHMTVQGVGFTDVIGKGALRAVINEVQTALARVPAPEVVFQSLALHPEAIVLPATPPEGLREAKAVIRTALAEVLGPDKIEGPAEGYRPHVTVAYSATERDTTDLTTHIDSSPPPSAARVTITDLTLVTLRRDRHAYRWQPVADARLSANER